MSPTILITSFKEVDLDAFDFVEGVKGFEARWIGWAGVNVPDEIGQRALTDALAQKVTLLYQIRHFFFAISRFTLF